MPPTDKIKPTINPSEAKPYTPPKPGDIFCSVRGPNEIEFGFVSHVAFYGTKGDGTRDWGAIVFSGRAEVASFNNGRTWYGDSDWHPATPEELALFGERAVANDPAVVGMLVERVAFLSKWASGLHEDIGRHAEAIALHGGEIALQNVQILALQGHVAGLEKESITQHGRIGCQDDAIAALTARLDEMQAALDDATKTHVRIEQVDPTPPVTFVRIPDPSPVEAVPAPGGPPPSLRARPRVGAEHRG